MSFAIVAIASAGAALQQALERKSGQLVHGIYYHPSPVSEAAPRYACVNCGAPHDGNARCSYCLTIRDR